jgi:hypothetical protein
MAADARDRVQIWRRSVVPGTGDLKFGLFSLDKR